MNIPFFPLFKKKKKSEFIPLAPSPVPYGTDPNLLKQAIEDSRVVRATAFANARRALEDAFNKNIFPVTKSLDAVDKDVESTLNDVKPQIGYPGFVKSTKSSKETEIEPDMMDFLKNGIILPDKSLLDVSDPKNNASYYKPTPIVDGISERFKKLAGVSGAFQHSLKPKSNTIKKDYDFIVTVGNPHTNRIILNCIKNSKDYSIFFKDNLDVILNAIDEFNSNYDPKSMFKTILSGYDDKNYMNINLEFNSLYFDGDDGVFRVDFFRHDIHSTGVHDAYVDYDIKCIKDTIYFYLEGELYLDESETKIESMKIVGLNYSNPRRNIISEKFVYLH